VRDLRDEVLDGYTIPSRQAALGINLEIRRTWEFLFAANNNSGKRDLENYGRIRKAPWTFGADDHLQKSRHLSTGRLYVQTTRHRHPEALSYSQFPLFETRIRQLVFYMDTQKPQGLRQLWRDKRDTLNFYTFWGVIIFGGLSVFLALFSLAMSIAQTVASFRALDNSS
jgi:hypothetical protein